VVEEEFGYNGTYGMQFSRYQGLVSRVRSIWRDMSERPLDVKVMKLPYLGVEQGQRDGRKGKGEICQ